MIRWLVGEVSTLMRGRQLLLWLWRWLPIPDWLRSAFLWWTNARFLVGVSALILDDHGQVLVIKHTYRRAYPWGLPGGWIRASESPLDGLTREVGEETGLEIEVGELIGAALTPSPRHIHLVYHAWVRRGDFRPSAEATELRYVPVTELGRLIVPDDRWVVPIAQRLGCS